MDSGWDNRCMWSMLLAFSSHFSIKVTNCCNCAGMDKKNVLSLLCGMNCVFRNIVQYLGYSGVMTSVSKLYYRSHTQLHASGPLHALSSATKEATCKISAAV